MKRYVDQDLCAQHSKLTNPPKVHNVIIFGQTGAGKSSIINMLECSPDASTSSGVSGHTFSSERHEAIINGQNFNIYDTNGLNEAEEGKIPTKYAIKNLYQLVQCLKGGISLLVFVFRGPRIDDASVRNYKMFRETFCNCRVPIVIIITGLENESNMDQWWNNNSMDFDNHQMFFDGQACITATRGKQTGTRWTLDKEYVESKDKVKRLIANHVADEPWDMYSADWFSLALRQLVLASEPGSRARLKLLAKALKDNTGMSRRRAWREAKKYSRAQANGRNLPFQPISPQTFDIWNRFRMQNWGGVDGNVVGHDSGYSTTFF
jgi:predicted GTPase